jgi:PAS domain S-box-containing protein
MINGIDGTHPAERHGRAGGPALGLPRAVDQEEERDTFVLGRLMWPLAAVLVFLVVLAAALLWHQQERWLREAIDHRIGEIPERLLNIETKQIAVMSALLDVITADAAVREALRAGDRERLLALSRETFEYVHKEHGLNHFYFLDKDRYNLLRVQDPQRTGGWIDRYTAREAERTGRLVGGIELGYFGILMLRVVKPVYSEGELIGYVELSRNIDGLLRKLHREEGVEIAVSLHKKQLSRETWEEGSRLIGLQPDWDRYPSDVVSYSSLRPLPDGLLEGHLREYDQADHDRRLQVKAGGRVWRVAYVPVEDASGHDIGDLTVMLDVTAVQKAFWRTMTGAGALALAVLTLLMAFLFTLLKRTDERILAQQRELRHAGLRQRAIFDAVTDGIVMTDERGCIDLVNPAMQAVFGYQAEELHGRHIGVLLSLPPGDACDTQSCPAAPAGATWVGSVRYGEMEGRRKDGRVLPIELTVSEAGIEGRRLFVTVMRDITERKRLERLAALRTDVLDLIAKGAPLAEILETIARGVDAQDPDLMCSVLVLDERRKRLTTGAAPALPSFYQAAVNATGIGKGENALGAAVRTGRRVLVEDVRTHPDWVHWSEITARASLGSCWSEPIRNAAGKLLGILAVYRRQPGGAAGYDARLIEHAADLAAVAIEHARARDKLVRGIATRFLDLGVEALGGGIDDALARIGAYAGADRCHFFRFSPGHGEALSAVHEWCAEGIEPHIGALRDVAAAEGSPLMELLRRFEVVSTASSADLSAAPVDRRYFEEGGIRSVLMVPVALGEEQKGFLGFDAVRAERPWCEADLKLLQVTAEIISEAFARRAAARRKALEESCLRAFVRLSGMHGAQDQAVLDLTREEIVQLTGSRYGFIGWIEDGRLAADQEHAAAGSADRALFVAPDGTGPWTEPLRARGPTILDDCAQAFPDCCGASAERGAIRHYLGVPVFDGERIVLVAGVAGREEGYTEADAAAVSSVMNEAWHVIERNRTERELSASREKLRELAAYHEKIREGERASIAREIHDELGQCLTALRLYANLIESHCDPADAEIPQHVAAMVDTIDTTLGVVRHIASALRPAVLDMGLIPAVEWLLSSTAQRAGFEYSLEACRTEHCGLDGERTTALFRILQEALTNIARHARASRVRVCLKKDGDDILMLIEDDGVGFTPGKEPKKTFGLLGMNERAIMLGGETRISSAPGQGTSICVRIPCAPGEQPAHNDKRPQEALH